MKINNTDKRYSDLERQNTNLHMDSKGKEVQNQITEAKNRLKELAASNGLNEEEKEKKRQQLQKKLTELNKELRKRQIELQRSQQEQKKNSVPAENEDKTGSNAKPADPKTETRKPPQTGTKALIAAESAINHAGTHKKLAAELKSKVRILQGEIEQDEARGKDASSKLKELEKLEKKAAKLNGAGFNFLADASKELREAAEKERNPGKKNRNTQSDGFVRPLKTPFRSAPKAKTDIYIKQNLFSNVDFHF